MNRAIPRHAPTAVILNDTAMRGHHGCSRVMRLLVAGLESRGIRVAARAPAHTDWAKNHAFVQALGAADLLVVNGEGTLHHGRADGARLLDVLRHPARRAPAALVNALWQENPAGWGEALAGFSLIAARDSQSAEAMRAAQSEVAVRMVPDLSLSQTAPAGAAAQTLLIFGDSVRWGTRRTLAQTARRLGADALLPTKTLPGALWRLPGISAGLSALYYGTHPFGLPQLRLAHNEADYLNYLGSARLHVTGRFHGVCLSLLVGAPFIAVGSNSWKIEALLDDAGLPRNRLLAPEKLARLGPADLARPFSMSETTAIASYLIRAQTEAARLFDDLAKLARGEI